MSGVNCTRYLPGTASKSYAEVRFVWQEGALDEAAMEKALAEALHRARELMMKRKRDEDQKTADVGPGEG